ncbi:MAG: hypothetical protein BWY83_00263 [bacterium ADurb.Bin478]|nr:MAG: hypothetical protein BWY83_00263 [bacterium ADurb.Bin478]
MIDAAAEHAKARKKSQQSAQRTEVATPEAARDQAQRQHAGEQQQNRYALFKGGGLNRQQPRLHPSVERVPLLLRHAAGQSELKEALGQQRHGWIETDREHTGEHDQRIEEPGGLPGKERRTEQGDQDEKFPRAKPDAFAAGAGFTAAETAVAAIDHRAQRADPAAEKAPQRNGEQQQKDSRKHGGDPGPCGQSRGQRSQRAGA